MQRNKIAITGANGFVGGSVYKKLTEKGYDVIKLVRVPGEGEYYFDISDLGVSLSYLSEVNTIVHCASIIDQNDLTDMELIRINSIGAKNLFDNALKHGVINFINISTGAVYGNSYLNKISELEKCNPSNAYAKSKLFAENYCTIGNGMRSVHFRLFFPYGDNQKGRLIPNLINKVNSGNNIILNKYGTPIITPIHIQDVISYIEMAINSDIEGVFNICGDETISILEIAYFIGKVLNKDVFLNFNDNVESNYIGDNSKIKNISNIFPIINFEYGLRMMINNEVKL